MHSTGIIKCLLKIVKRNNQVYVYEYKFSTTLLSFTENKWKTVNCSKGLSILDYAGRSVFFLDYDEVINKAFVEST
jgi:hypothetical protein